MDKAYATMGVGQNLHFFMLAATDAYIASGTQPISNRALSHVRAFEAERYDGIALQGGREGAWRLPFGIGLQCDGLGAKYARLSCHTFPKHPYQNDYYIYHTPRTDVRDHNISRPDPRRDFFRQTRLPKKRREAG